MLQSKTGLGSNLSSASQGLTALGKSPQAALVGPGIKIKGDNLWKSPSAAVSSFPYHLPYTEAWVSHHHMPHLSSARPHSLQYSTKSFCGASVSTSHGSWCFTEGNPA